MEFPAWRYPSSEVWYSTGYHMLSNYCRSNHYLLLSTQQSSCLFRF